MGTRWWPGISRVDGYVLTDGTRVGYQHIAVVDPPRILHVPVGAAPAAAPLTIEATVKCATEKCSATLHYTTQLTVSDLPQASVYRSVPMRPTGTATPTPLGTLQRWAATIPANEVTSTDLAYFIEASDGYARSYGPGTDYWGAYVPLQGQRAGALDSAQLAPTGITYGTAGPDQNTTVAQWEDGAWNFLNLQAGMAFPVRVLEPPVPVPVI